VRASFAARTPLGAPASIAGLVPTARPCRRASTAARAAAVRRRPVRGSTVRGPPVRGSAIGRAVSRTVGGRRGLPPAGLSGLRAALGGCGARASVATAAATASAAALRRLVLGLGATGGGGLRLGGGAPVPR